MILGTGVDIVEVERIKEAMQQHSFAQKIFSEAEQKYCEARKSQKYASYAARFAGKEAFVKALGTGFRGGTFAEISIENDSLGCPFITVSGFYQKLIEDKKITNISISLSHTKKYAMAQVIVEG